MLYGGVRFITCPRRPGNCSRCTAAAWTRRSTRSSCVTSSDASFRRCPSLFPTARFNPSTCRRYAPLTLHTITVRAKLSTSLVHLKAKHAVVVVIIRCPSRDYISKTVQDRPITTMEVGVADSVAYQILPRRSRGRYPGFK